MKNLSDTNQKPNPDVEEETSAEKELTHKDIIRFIIEQNHRDELYHEAMMDEPNSDEVVDDGDVLAVSIADEKTPSTMSELPIVHPEVLDADDDMMEIEDVRDSLRMLYSFKDEKEEASYEQMKAVVHNMLDNYTDLIAERRYRISAGPGNYKRSRIATIDNSIRVAEHALEVVRDRCPEILPEITPYDFNEEIPINEELRAKKEAVKEKRNQQHRCLIIRKHQEIVETLGPSMLYVRPLQDAAYFVNAHMADAAQNLPKPKNYKAPSIKRQAEKIKQEKVQIRKEIKTEKEYEKETVEMIDIIKSTPKRIEKWFSKHWKKRYTKALCSAISLVISAVVAGIASNYTRTA